ncbi:hypothetical protein Fot_52997 [Forsythia ovata]|uniref:GTD-binding domain-containing protein n=1 Tax=Forsythia ovata TaxID=205694 RepID=A0ABD1PHE2_9LAMI
MVCKAVHFWNLRDLVGAFLDLAIAYLLLCAATIAFLATKFLAFFGLSLPCPCNGLFFNKNYCLQRLLVDYPTESISNIQLSVKQKFPFNDSLWRKNVNNDVNGILEMEGGASCCSVSDAKKAGNVVRRELSARDEKYDAKGKGVLNYKPRSGMHRHRKGDCGHGKYSSVSSYDPSLCEWVQDGVLLSPSSISRGENEITRDNEKAPTIMGVWKNARDGVEMNKFSDEDILMKKHVSSIGGLLGKARGDLGFNVDEKISIELLEEVLKEEHAACAALYIELEKERSAAATAVDEAMAMILRLQEEKASVEMEARKNQRVIEEKSAYDAEEMYILKEILVRREREKHFLENEVEAYRHLICPENEQLAGDIAD